ncbi:MAG: hypothetical protein QHG99_07890 [Methanomicrobiales archaeon]|nr:hypothetical protein [Methanomicrobiales archaeon]
MIEADANELLRWAEEEMKREKQEEALLFKSEIMAHQNTLIIIVCLLVNIVVATLLPNYTVAWIAASFFLYVLAPLIMLVPTDGGKEFLPQKDELERYFAIIRDYGFLKDTKTLGQVIWNVFFINSQSLAIGYCVIFLIDIIFSSVSGFFTGTLPQVTAVQVILQSIVIIVFFTGIWKYKPYSPHFVDSVHQMHERLRSRMKEAWKIILVLGGISAGLSLLVVMAMLLPGFILGEVVKAPDVVNAITAFPIALIFISQLAVLRYLQGVYSKELALRLITQKVQSLKKIQRDLRRVISTSDKELPESDPSEGLLNFNELQRHYLKTRLYTTKRHSLFGYLPVYMVVPNFSLIIGKGSIPMTDWSVPMSDTLIEE